MFPPEAEGPDLALYLYMGIGFTIFLLLMRICKCL